MAIISASRKTDIPAFFSEWFINRIESGDIYTRNSLYNPNMVQHLSFKKEDIDCIVFWTKNPLPMMSKIDRLKDWKYYFQFTITGYGKDMEKNLPNKLDLIKCFKELSLKTDKKVVWRYDPIIFTSHYNIDWHLKVFESMAKMLQGYTDRCIISFINYYDVVKANLITDKINSYQLTNEQKNSFLKKMVSIAHSNNITLYSCAEDFEASTGVIKGSCIDKDYIENIVGYTLKGKKDKGQREKCQCIESYDVGKYSTCLNGCKYCYACKETKTNFDVSSVYDNKSPILCDSIKINDIINDKALKSLKIYVDENPKLSLF